MLVAIGQVFGRPTPDSPNLRTVCRLQTNNLNVGVLRFQKSRYPHDGSSCAHRGNKARHVAAGLLPNLRARRGEMAPGVIRNGELIQHQTLTAGLHPQG